jgi:putative serine protease PepD
MGHGDSHDDEPRDGDEHDDHQDEPVRGGGPPHPLDRIWVHPSELPVGPGLAAPKPAAKGASRWFAPALAGVAGALATIVVLAASGALSRASNDTPAASAPATTVATPTNAITNAVALGFSMVAVSARDDSGTRRGTGVCVRHGSEVLTSAALVGNASRVTIVTSDGHRHSARVVGRDRTTDLVLLGINATLQAAQLADHSPAPGSPVWIVGAPSAGSTAPWMSTGVLSSADAVVTASSGPWTGGLLETDAASGSQASGAALVDASGMVTGIVLGRVSSGDTTYAVPIGEATRVSEELHDDGVAQHGTLGFEGINADSGPMVTKVTPGGPADGAGVHTGDIVESVDDHPVEFFTDVMALIRGNAPGTKVQLELRRGSNAFRLQIVLGATRG